MSAAVRTTLAAASPTPEDKHPEEKAFPQPLRLRLRARVVALDYAACAALLCQLLEAAGYETVRPAGRTTLHGYNRPGGGGWDIAATLPAGVGSRQIIVRLKHLPREPWQPDPKPVHQRCVDELRGACLRAGAAEGLLVSTGEFSLTARRLAEQEEGVAPVGIAPVRLVDAEELVELLLRHRLGVREAIFFPGIKFSSKRRLELDEAFFRNLRASPTPSMAISAPKAAPQTGSDVPAKDAATATAWHVNVRLITLHPNAGKSGGTGTGRMRRRR